MSATDVTDLKKGIVGDSEWCRRWREDESHWHSGTVDPFLEENGPTLFGDAMGQIFVPLCGKSPDLLWLYNHGHTVVGAEIAEQPIAELFKENNIEHKVEDSQGVGRIYRSNDGRLTVFVANIFRIPVETFGKFDFIWDKASFTAINLEDHKRYRDLIYTIIKPGGVSYLKTIEYDETVWPGPPHSTSDHVVRETFGDACNIKLLKEITPPGFGPTCTTEASDHYNKVKSGTADEKSDKVAATDSKDTKSTKDNGKQKSDDTSGEQIKKEGNVYTGGIGSNPEPKKCPEMAAITTSSFLFNRYYKLSMKQIAK